jgi:hypothetical protein
MKQSAIGFSQIVRMRWASVDHCNSGFDLVREK